jgi:hypothetical protein
MVRIQRKPRHVSDHNALVLLWEIKVPLKYLTFHFQPEYFKKISIHVSSGQNMEQTKPTR